MKTSEIEGLLSTLREGDSTEIENAVVKHVPAEPGLKAHYAIWVNGGAVRWAYSAKRATEYIVKRRNETTYR